MISRAKQPDHFEQAWTSKICANFDAWAGKNDSSLESLYFGGGTPSLLSCSSLEKIRRSIQAAYRWFDPVEWTLEANPEDITPDKLQTWAEFGVNRLSIGVQSFQEGELKRLERLATRTQLEKIFDFVHQYIPNFSVDLMFGIPDQTLARLDMSLQTALALSPPHLSIYLLTIASDHKWKTNKFMAPRLADEHLVSEMYALICERMSQAGYTHYEVSNFAKKGFESLHNQNYWNPKKSYLGLGPGAHGYDAQKHTRYFMIHSLKKWLDSENPVEDSEQLNAEQQFIEMLYLSLRRRDPMECRYFDAKKLKILNSEGLIEIQGDQFYVPEKALILLDGICSELLASLNNRVA